MVTIHTQSTSNAEARVPSRRRVVSMYRHTVRAHYCRTIELDPTEASLPTVVAHAADLSDSRLLPGCVSYTLKVRACTYSHNDVRPTDWAHTEHVHIWLCIQQIEMLQSIWTNNNNNRNELKNEKIYE